MVNNYDKSAIRALFNVYRVELAKHIQAEPAGYMADSNADAIADKFEAKLLTGGMIGGINIRTPSWRNTCKVLGISHTYKALTAYLTKAD